MFYEIGVFKNLANLTGKHLCRSFFSIKLQASLQQFYWKKRLWYRCFLMNFARHLRHFFYRTPQKKKRATHAEKELTQVFIFCYCSKISLLHFSLLLMIHWKHVVLQKQLPLAFFKKVVYESFAIFTGKHLCWSLFFIKFFIKQALKF